MNQSWAFTVWGNPIGKPRMTQRDKWQKRACVMRYRSWADAARGASQNVPLPSEPLRVEVIAYLPFPRSWSQKKKDSLANEFHRQKPDGDNILKAVCDALFEEDKAIAIKRIEKRWDDGQGPRVEVNVFNHPPLCPTTESNENEECV